MIPFSYRWSAFGLALGGMLFSGYLSLVRFITNKCALAEPCPYFLGYPACWYGFGMFLILFTTATLVAFRKISERKMAQIHVAVAGFGILFAGSFTAPELTKLLSGTKTVYTLGLPSCAYGLVFYIILFVLALTQFLAKKRA